MYNGGLTIFDFRLIGFEDIAAVLPPGLEENAAEKEAVMLPRADTLSPS